MLTPSWYHIVQHIAQHVLSRPTSWLELGASLFGSARGFLRGVSLIFLLWTSLCAWSGDALMVSPCLSRTNPIILGMQGTPPQLTEERRSAAGPPSFCLILAFNLPMAFHTSDWEHVDALIEIYRQIEPINLSQKSITISNPLKIENLRIYHRMIITLAPQCFYNVLRFVSHLQTC